MRSFDNYFVFLFLFAFSHVASYGVEDPEFAITQLAQMTMQSALGKMSFEKVLREREPLNVSIVDSINKASLAWGITCLRYQIRIRNTKVSNLLANFMKRIAIDSGSLHFSYLRTSMEQCKRSVLQL